MESLDTRIGLESPEHVVFHHELAGPGPRAVAWMVDLMAESSIVSGIAASIYAVTDSLNADGLGAGMVMVLWFVVDWGWFTAWEALGNGQTPGKRAVGIHVVREDGRPIGWSQALIRNLLRPADALPLAYVFGFLSMCTDARFRRLGDRVAGTVVLVLPDRESRETWAPPKLQPPVTPTEAAMLPARPPLGRPVREALEAWATALPTMNPPLAEATAKLGAPLAEVAGVHHPDPIRRMQLTLAALWQVDEHILKQVHARQPAWDALAALLTRLRVEPLQETDAHQLLTLFRSLCADLGRFRASALSTGAFRALEHLCIEAQQRIYRAPAATLRVPFSRVWHFIQREFPAEVRTNRYPVLLAALLFLFPMGLAIYQSMASPMFLSSVLDPNTQQMLEESYQKLGRTSDENAQMAGFYVNNNVGIALRSVAAGLLFGVGTAWVMLFNGLMIGAVAGFLIHEGLGENLLKFVIGHSAWELTALIIAGGAGLKLGWSLIDTGGLTRSASVRRQMPHVLRLALGAAFMLFVAAMIEGFWSALPLSLPIKLGFGACQFVLVGLWLARGGR